MKKLINQSLTFIGLLLIIVGIIIAFFGKAHIHIRFIRPEFVPWVMIFCGIILIVIGVTELLTSRLKADSPEEIKQIEIEKKDERNIAIGNAAKARAYELMSVLFAFVLIALALLDYINTRAFFILVTLFFVCQIYFVYRLWKYEKEM
ncbi:hypothetical protein MmiHf6_03270 [Methanimicrococcus hongohii]|uniref:DUF2178 domain-containing protein n=1 Tax=Methanimicrococcus hongohii TaxID=3028295 RepID=A0AA96ZTC1_9EURY|nr:hypothetical protein [Methanimicrococcus sp. Hf6]WNY23031.1 hypothetical protein MmiHf6_03270 [Methanimicrococcus sp. Hf6]